MRVFVAGATGAIGRPLIEALVGADHEVVGMTRSRERGQWLRRNGAQAAIADAFDAKAVHAAVRKARPQVVMDQMTDLPQRIVMMGGGLRAFYRGQNRLRRKGSETLLEAAREVGAEKVITQSVAFVYAPNGGGLKREDDRIWTDGPPPFAEAVTVAAEHDEQVIASGEFTGIVLRYGNFYGPGTHFAPGNGVWNDARRRRMPLVGDGEGVWSFIHVADAAAATVIALERADAGIYNIVDDDPALYREWVPYYAEIVGGKPPMHVPQFLANLFSGPAVTAWATNRPGASNAKAKRELGWSPRFASWREGFRHGLDEQSTRVP